MRVTLFLADAAQPEQATSKVHALGAGWSVTGSPTPPMAVVALIKVPWDQANTQHVARLELVDADGQPVTVQGPAGAQALKVEQVFEVGRPPGLPRGIEIDHSICVNLGPGLPLQPGMSYQWRLTMDGDEDTAQVATFFIRQQPSPPPQG
ncbi:MAG: hypothetical protein ACFCVG_15780 [Kineosporiaceae bacterium]